MVSLKFKGPVSENYKKKIPNNKNSLNKLKRNLKILPKHLDQTFQIHNGKTFEKILITKEMLGHKFGEFVFTRAKFKFTKKKKSRK